MQLARRRRRRRRGEYATKRVVRHPLKDLRPRAGLAVEFLSRLTIGFTDYTGFLIPPPPTNQEG